MALPFNPENDTDTTSKYFNKKMTAATSIGTTRLKIWSTHCLHASVIISHSTLTQHFFLGLTCEIEFSLTSTLSGLIQQSISTDLSSPAASFLAEMLKLDVLLFRGRIFSELLHDFFSSALILHSISMDSKSPTSFFVAEIRKCE